MTSPRRSQTFVLFSALGAALAFVSVQFSPFSTALASWAPEEAASARERPDLLCSLVYYPSSRIDPPAQARVAMAVWSDGSTIGRVGDSYRVGTISPSRLTELRESLQARSAGLTVGNHFPPGSEWYELRVVNGDGATLRTSWNLRPEYLANATVGPFTAAWSGITTEMMLLFDELDGQLTDDPEMLERARSAFPMIR